MRHRDSEYHPAGERPTRFASCRLPHEGIFDLCPTEKRTAAQRGVRSATGDPGGEWPALDPRLGALKPELLTATCMRFLFSIFSVVLSPGRTSERPGILPGPIPDQLNQSSGVGVLGKAQWSTESLRLTWKEERIEL